MAGYAYQQDDELDRKRDDQTHLAPADQGGQSHGPDAATQSIAEIGQLYPDGAGGMLDVEHQQCVAPEVDQLALHGAATEPAHVDPIAASVAQAELETQPAAPVAVEAQDSNDAEGPESGKVEHGKAESPATVQDGLPASPAAVLTGAATGLTSAVAEGPAAPSKSEAAPAATPGSPPDGAHAAKPAASWEDRARAYNQRHGLTAQFNAATHDACGSGADADPRVVAAWQTAHGLHPDGRIGHLTIGAATKQAPKAEAHDETAAPVSPHAEVAPAKPVAEVKPVAEAKPAHVEAKPAHVESKPAPVAEAKPVTAQPVAPAVTPTPVAPAVTAKPVAPVSVAPPAGGDDSFAGTEDIRGKEKDRWAAYGKGDAQTHGWDLGGAHGAKHSGGDVSAAIYATANVEGRYDSVQTYDAGILSFGIMQWTLHAGSLQKFLGFLKDKSGPEGRAAFQEDFVANGIDVAASGGQYQLVYNGKQYPLGDDGAGKAEIDALVRTDPKVARKWSEVFHAAGADPRVQKAQFERAKDMFHEAEGVRFGDKIVDQSLKACKNTFHAKYRSQYGKAQSWMSASPKAAALFFSMRVNNPKYANAAFLKAIDAFYDAQGTNSTTWPKNWGDTFGDLVAAKSAETLSNWGKEGGGEGRVDKTLRFWDKVHGKPASAPSADANKSTVAQAPKLPPAAAIASKEDSKDAKASKPDPAFEKKLQAQYAGVLHQFVVGQIDQAEAVRKLIAYDQKLNGGHSSIACLILLPAFLADLVKATLARAPKPAPPAPVAEAKPAPAKPVAPTVKPTVEPRVVADTTKAPTPVTPVKAPPVTPHVDPAPAQVAPPTSGMTAFVIEAEGQFCQIYVSPGGLTNDSPDVFMFFHGHDAQLGIDPSLQGQKGNASGEDSAGAAMAQAKTKNTIAILPQGVLGGGGSHTKEGGFMSALHSGKPGAFATFVDAILAQVGPKLGREHELVPRHISLAGHSAGGYQGIHDALSSAAKGKYADTISDITLMDSSYSPTHFGDTRDWLFTGSPGKTVRIVQSPDQLKHGYTKDKDKKTVVVEAWHKKYFDEGKLDAYAKAHKMSIKTQSVAGDDRGSNTRAVQHTQIITADGKVQGDVLILESALDHHAIRDNVIDDSIDSIGQGEAGADSYGKNHIDNYGRKQEPKHDKHDKHAPKAGALVPAPAPADAKHDAAIANPDKVSVDQGKATGPLKTEAKPSAEDQAAVKPEHGHDEDHTPAPTTDGKEKVSGGKPKAFIAVGREVYKTGGELSHDHLGHGSATTDLTNKDPKKRHIHLDDAQYRFKQDCYDIATASLGDHIYGGVAKGDLGKTENGLDYRSDCVPHLASLLGALRSAMANGEVVKNDKGVEIKAPTNGGITVNSAYRSPAYDFGLWDSYFQHYFIESIEQREKIPEGPLSHKAAQWLVSNIIAWRKAPPGGSNHSNGNAVDLARTVNGKHQSNDYDDQRAWRSSWEYFWLKENALTYGFTNYKKEAWHWEWWANPAAKR